MSEGSFSVFMVETGSRVELYHEHGLGVLLIATAIKAQHSWIARIEGTPHPPIWTL